MTGFTDLELLALHVCVHSARFESPHLRSELVDNPHLASGHARIVAEIRRRTDDKDSMFSGKGHEWRAFVASIDAELLTAAAARSTRHPDWSSMSEAERVAWLQAVLLPFDVDDADALEALSKLP